MKRKKLENQKDVLLEERSVAILVGRRVEEKKSRSEKKPIHTAKTQNVNKIEKRQGAEELCKEEQPAREGKVLKAFAHFCTITKHKKLVLK